MKINKFLMATAAVAVFAGGVLPYTAARADMDQLDTQALIVVAMDVNCTQALNFGELAADSDGGSIAVDATGSETPTSLVVLDNAAISEGTCSVTGDTTRAYSITLVPSVLTGPLAATMSLSSFVIDTTSGGSFTGLGPHTANLVAGADTLSIGATLTLAANQQAGAYTGTVDVTVDYQ